MAAVRHRLKARESLLHEVFPNCIFSLLIIFLPLPELNV